MKIEVGESLIYSWLRHVKISGMTTEPCGYIKNAFLQMPHDAHPVVRIYMSSVIRITKKALTESKNCK